MGVLEDLFDVRDQVALVTGGASGLGYAFASILADCGATVVVADWNGERLEKELRGLSSHGRVAGYPLDVTDAPAVRACVDSIVAEYKSLDIAFANAGVARGSPPLLPEGWLDDMSMTDYRALIAQAPDSTGKLALAQKLATRRLARGVVPAGDGRDEPR